MRRAKRLEEERHLTLAYFEYYDDQRFPMRLVGDFRLTPRVSISPDLEMGGGKQPAGFTVVSPKKNVYFWADSAVLKQEWVRALTDGLERVRIRLS